jgi:hypothetical protein
MYQGVYLDRPLNALARFFFFCATRGITQQVRLTSCSAIVESKLAASRINTSPSEESTTNLAKVALRKNRIVAHFHFHPFNSMVEKSKIVLIEQLNPIKTQKNADDKQFPTDHSTGAMKGFLGLSNIKSSQVKIFYLCRLLYPVHVFNFVPLLFVSQSLVYLHAIVRVLRAIVLLSPSLESSHNKKSPLFNI